MGGSMLVLFRALIGIGVVGGLLVLILWSEHQVSLRTPAHTHYLAQTRLPYDEVKDEDASNDDDVDYRIPEDNGEEELDSAHQSSTSASMAGTDFFIDSNVVLETAGGDEQENDTSTIPTTSFTIDIQKNESIKIHNNKSRTITPNKGKGVPKQLSTKKSSKKNPFPHLVIIQPKSYEIQKPSMKPEMGALADRIESKLMDIAGHKIDFGSKTENLAEPNYDASLSKQANSHNAQNTSNVIYIITPTYRRPEQVAELTRLSQTLMLVPNLHWLVAEDAKAPTKRVLAFLNDCKLRNTYLLGSASSKYSGPGKPRGVSNRNAGLKWLKNHATSGVIYFADDDNTYDYRIFEEIRLTKRVGMFPVGLVTKLGVSSPIVTNGKVIGFYDGWIAGRRFPVDMAGFSVNVQFYKERGSPMMPMSVGYEEDGFLKALKLQPQDIEPMANNCTKILVWHTRTMKSAPAIQMPDTEKVSRTNLEHLKPNIVFKPPYT